MNRNTPLGQSKTHQAIAARGVCVPPPHLPPFKIQHLSISRRPKHLSLMQITNNGRKLSGRDNPEQSILGLQGHRLHNTHLASAYTVSPPPWHTHTHTHTPLSPVGTIEGGHTIVSARKKKKGKKITDLLQNWPYSAREYQVIESVHAESTSLRETISLSVRLQFCSWSRTHTCAVNAERSRSLKTLRGETTLKLSEKLDSAIQSNTMTLYSNQTNGVDRFRETLVKRV